MAGVMLAYIDESGQRGTSEKSSDHFVLSAVVLVPGALFRSTELLAEMRRELGRSPRDQLHWRKLKTHDEKVRAAQLLGRAPFLHVCSVVVCKRKFDGPKLPHENLAYMYTFRLLLERLSWLAQRRRAVVSYTLAHVIRFKLATLRQYEQKLREMSPDECKVAWDHVDPAGGRLNYPRMLEQLQLADLSASATAEAFEPNKFGNIETRYLNEFKTRVWTPGGPITSYGLKMHPWNDKTRAGHPWLEDF